MLAVGQHRNNETATEMEMKRQQALINLHSDCELNFVRLSKLMPNMEVGAEKHFLAGNYDEFSLQIKVTDSDRYTRFLLLTGSTADLPWAGEQRMAVRLYLDACMAEVISCGAERVRLLGYSYPNERMYSPDEKNQINRFLGKWLEHFIQFGRAMDSKNKIETVSGEIS